LFIFFFPAVIGYEGAFIVQTGSMEPTIPTGSVIFVNEKKPENIEERDVITFYSRTEGRTIRITHRVTEISNFNGKYYYLTKGDANSEPDSAWIPEENLIGTVEFTVPEIGFVIQRARTNPFLMLLIISASMILILNEAQNLVDQNKHLKSYK
jgi:signal peptidase